MNRPRMDSGDTPFMADREEAHFPPGASRREFLRTLAVAGAAAVLPVGESFAQATPASANLKTGRIDVHHHALSPNFMKAAGVGASWHWSPAVSLEQMDKCG